MEMTISTNAFCDLNNEKLQQINGGAWYDWLSGAVCGIIGLVGGGLTGAVAGAAVGSVTLPVVGTVSGTVVGLIGGACTGAVAGFCAGYELFS